MRDRLVELLNNKYDHFCDQCGVNKDSHYTNNLADYLLENGVIVQPCKVGQKVYFVHEVCDENADEYFDISDGEVVSFSMQKDGLWMFCRYDDGLTYWHLVVEDFDKTVFTSREDAEKALRGDDGK